MFGVAKFWSKKVYWSIYKYIFENVKVTAHILSCHVVLLTMGSSMTRFVFLKNILIITHKMIVFLIVSLKATRGLHSTVGLLTPRCPANSSFELSGVLPTAASNSVVSWLPRLPTQRCPDHLNFRLSGVLSCSLPSLNLLYQTACPVLIPY